MRLTSLGSLLLAASFVTAHVDAAPEKANAIGSRGSAEYHNGPWRVSRFRVADLGLKRSSTRLNFTFQITDDVSAAAIDDVWLWDMDCDPPPPEP